MNQTSPKYYSIILSLILLVFYHQAIAQKPSIDSLPPIPPFSITFYGEIDHINYYTSKQFRKRNIKQAIEIGGCSIGTDTSKVIKFNRDGWIQEIIENRCQDYKPKIVTTLNEIIILDKNFKLKFSLKEIDSTGILIREHGMTKEFNQKGLIESMIYYGKDTFYYHYYYDSYNRSIYEKEYSNSKITNYKSDTITSMNPVQYKYIKNKDTIIVIEYSGKLDTSSNDVNYYKGIQSYAFTVNGNKYNGINYKNNFYYIHYIYHFNKSGKLLYYDEFMSYFDMKKNKTGKTSPHWVRLGPNTIEKMKSRSLKFIYY